jgi:hypothetical protein
LYFNGILTIEIGGQRLNRLPHRASALTFHWPLARSSAAFLFLSRNNYHARKFLSAELRNSAHSLETDLSWSRWKHNAGSDSDTGGIFKRWTWRRHIMLGTVLLVILILLLIGAFPSWGYSRGWGYGPSGGLGLVLVIVLILLLMGRI